MFRLLDSASRRPWLTRAFALAGLAIVQGACVFECGSRPSLAEQLAALYDGSLPDSPVAPDGAPPLSPDGAPLTPICSLQVGAIGTFEGRTIYGVDVSALELSGGCPLEPGDVFPSTAPISIGFLGGSPGHSINVRGDYRLLSASPAVLRGEGYSADAQENVLNTFTAQRRPGFDGPTNDGGLDGGDGGDGGGIIEVPAPVYTIEYRMKSDPDPSKWVVEIYSFTF